MGRRQAERNRGLTDDIIGVLHTGGQYLQDIAGNLKRHPLQIRNYLKKLVKYDYVRQTKDYYYINLDVEWCEGCTLIPDNPHPLEWCYE